MVMCGSKSGHERDTCLKVSRLCGQNMITIPNSIFNINGGGNLYDPLMSTISFGLVMKYIVKRPARFGFANHLVLIVCFIVEEKCRLVGKSNVVDDIMWSNDV